MLKPNDGESVWIEYPEGKHFRAIYRASVDTFVDGAIHIAATKVANWSRSEHEDCDISDDPTQQVGGKLTRDQ